MKGTQSHHQKGMKLTSKEQYSFCQKICCCRCFSCLQEQRVMDSDIRKETIKRMIEDYTVQEDDKVLYDPIKLMILIHVSSDDSIPSKHIERCKINPSTGIINYRTDLEFYIPQMCNYIVFHRSLKPNYLKDALQKMCKLNFYFAHLYYFYMKSIQRNVTKMESTVLQPVVDYNKSLREMLNEHYSKVRLTCLDLYIEKPIFPEKCTDQAVQQVIFNYETTKTDLRQSIKVAPENLILRNYESLFDDKTQVSTSFETTILFFNDLFNICDELKNFENKKEKVVECVKSINERLPAAVYIPFSKNSYRICNVLKIVTSEVRVFSTKERAPVCLCFQIYCPAEHLDPKMETIFWTNIETPFTLKMNDFSQRTDYLARKYEETIQYRNSRLQNLKMSFINIMQEEKSLDDIRNTYRGRDEAGHEQVDVLASALRDAEASRGLQQQTNHRATFEIEMRPRTGTKAQQKSSQQVEKAKPRSKSTSHLQPSTLDIYKLAFKKMFGTSLKESKRQIRQNSIFGNFSSWDLFYLIVKTHDDLKQEQFAIQLLHQFDYIFRLEKLPLLLTTYEVLSMGADRGIIEMVKDSVTFDSLKKTLKTQFNTPVTLREFFQVYFGENLVAAKEEFLKSLAAYCLVMYIIQAKDRHNGNILLHRSGKMFHIDFGFFLSNMPGKGIELQKDCPFKLLTEYVQVLDGTKSSYFSRFREYFFHGFKAIRKHQNKVIMLVKMMYTSSGMSMPCFSKGEQTISALEQRINPEGVTNDLLLNEHCQQLINQSLDNWAAKWYDRFQYWAQGIFY